MRSPSALSMSVDGAGFVEVCDGEPNSTGVASSLELLGTSTASANDLELAARQLPVNVFGYYLMSDSAASIPVGLGTLCLGSTVYRYNNNVLNSGPSGTVRFPLDLNQLADGQAAMVGDTQIFQLWHRDAVTGIVSSNFSGAVAVTFE